MDDDRHERAGSPGLAQYQAIEQAMIEKIRAGEWAEGFNLDTAERLAQAFGVSAGTVRHSLQSLAARGLVERAPRRGTTVAQGARGRIGGETQAATGTAYHLLVPDLRIPNFSGLARFVQEAGYDFDMEFSVHSVDDPGRFAEIIRSCLDRPTRGMIIVPPFEHGVPLSVLGKLEESDIPVVNIFRAMGDSTWPLLRGHPYEGIRQPLSHLVAAGYHRIGLIALPGDPRHPELCETFCRVEHEMGQRGLDFSAEQALFLEREADFVLHPYDLAARQVVQQQVAGWIEKHPGMDAFFCTDVDLAVMTVETLDRLGREVPEEVGVLTVGNIGAYAFSGERTLTAWDGDLANNIRRSCEMLAEMAAGKRYPPGYIEHWSGRFIQGTTTREPVREQEDGADSAAPSREVDDGQA